MQKQEGPNYVALWPDGIHKTNFQLHAKESYDLYKELRIASQKNHVEYGKWLIASMLAIHGGSLYALNSIRSSSPKISAEKAEFLISAACWNLFGIGAIMMAGFFAWLNFQMAEHVYDRWANPMILYRADNWPSDAEERTDPINATLFLAAALGLGSFFCFVAGAVSVVDALQ